MTYYSDNKKALLEKQKEYYEKNKEYRRIYQRAYIEKNKESIDKKKNEYYKKNRDKILLKEKEKRILNRKNNKIKVRIKPVIILTLEQRIIKKADDHRRYLKTRRTIALKADKKYRKKHKDKIRARGLVYSLKKRGKIEYSNCQVCGKEKTEMHHEDYNNPYEVYFLCKICHSAFHYNKLSLDNIKPYNYKYLVRSEK